MPNFRGKTQEEVILALRKLELNFGKVEEQASEEPAEFNKVIRQNPPADTKILKASSVNITIAKEPVADVAVPNLIEKTEKQATDALKKLGLKDNVKTGESSDTKKIGKVIEQSPPAKTKVTKGSQITITIAKKKD